MMKEDVFREFMALSEKDQLRVANLILSLRTESRVALTGEPEPQTELLEEPFFGVWREREDMRDSNAWVRETRLQEWTRSNA